MKVNVYSALDQVLAHDLRAVCDHRYRFSLIDAGAVLAKEAVDSRTVAHVQGCEECHKAWDLAKQLERDASGRPG